MTNLSPEQNRTRLDWVLSRFAGYVGATGAEGSLRGERFASLPEQIDPVLAELAQTRPAVRRSAAGRGADCRWCGAGAWISWSTNRRTAADIDDKLAQLAQLAREKGSALGLRRRGAAGHRAAARRLGERTGGRWSGAGPGQRPGAAAAGGAMSRACPTGRMSAPCCSTATAACSSRAAPICRTRKDPPAAGSCRRAASIRARTRAPRCCANWRRRSAPTAPRSSASIPTG